MLVKTHVDFNKYTSLDIPYIPGRHNMIRVLSIMMKNVENVNLLRHHQIKKICKFRQYKLKILLFNFVLRAEFNFHRHIKLKPYVF